MDDDTHYLKVPEVAELLRIPRTRAYELCAKGALPGVVRIGRSIRIDGQVLRGWLDDQMGDSGEKTHD